MTARKNIAIGMLVLVAIAWFMWVNYELIIHQGVQDDQINIRVIAPAECQFLASKAQGINADDPKKEKRVVSVECPKGYWDESTRIQTVSTTTPKKK